MEAIALRQPTPLAANPVQGLLQAFLSGRSLRTIEAYAQDLEDFKAFVGVDDVDQAARWLLSRG